MSSATRTFYVYVITNRTRVLYVGVTNNLKRRILEHKSRTVPGFSSRYYLDRLVYFEVLPDAAQAIHREKQIKAWRRSKKIELIESLNPDWSDFSRDLLRT